MKKLTKFALGAAGAAAAAGAGVMTVRALKFRPAPELRADPEEVHADYDRVVESLREMIRCRTVSDADPSLEDAAEFDKFRAYLLERYPRLAESCHPERIGRCGVLYTWRGRSSERPTVLMAHYDVVPADGEGWDEPPFEGVLRDGIIWGRGALDTKVTLCAVMEAAEQLIGEGFVPENDIYLAFSGEEEPAGPSAGDIVTALADRGVRPALVLDEGGAVVTGAFPGVAAPCALIGVAEKGQLRLAVEAESGGGHASSPPPHTIVGRLAAAVCRIEARPAPFTLTPPVEKMLDTLGRHASFPMRLVLANLGVFGPVLDLVCRKSGGELNALMRTTCAATQMKGSDANNVLPARAGVGFNLRVMNGESCDEAEARVRATVADPSLTVRRLYAAEPSKYSETEGEAWERLTAAVKSTWPKAVVSPYLMLAASDSRHYDRISRNVYRFCPLELSKEERGSIHGVNERIPTWKAVRCAEFYLRLIRSC
ncbi:MAG TPA: M20/M25/M40 family metallo-hydrolase [Candidatus Scatomorpha stercoravium]|nr:M20/M25/M40 family metallo-hydrolase [Candidatus Scatomorpha stercoravium]